MNEKIRRAAHNGWRSLPQVDASKQSSWFQKKMMRPVKRKTKRSKKGGRK